jgi:hypothetical protein
MVKSNERRIGSFFTALAALGFCCSEVAFAAESEVLYGVRATGQQYIIRSLDLGAFAPALERGRLAQARTERLAAIFQNRDGSIQLLRTSFDTRSSNHSLVQNAGVPGKVMDAGSWEIEGLLPAMALSGLVVPPSGTAVALVATYTDTPTFRLATVDIRSNGAMLLQSVTLNARTRFGHLTQCPGGEIYGISLGSESSARIVKIEISNWRAVRLVDLTFDGGLLSNDVSDLACAPSGKLYALADPKYSGINSVFSIDLSSGAMTMVRSFDADRIVFAR